MQEPYNPYATAPPMSGLYGIGNSLTAQGPATEPMNVNALPMDPRKKAIAMAMMQQQTQQKPQQGMAMPPPRPRQQFDLYGNPVL